MDVLRKQIESARRRLVAEQFLRRLVRCLLASLSVAAIAIGAPKVVVAPGLPEHWDQAWLLGAPLGSLVIAGVWTALRKRSSLDAAIEIDQRFALRERVASSLSLSEKDQGSPAGKALLIDAVRSVRRIELSDKFRVALGRQAWAPLAPAAIALCLMALLGNREAQSTPDLETAKIAKEQVKKSAEELRKEIARRRKEAEKQGLKDATGLLKQVEKETEELTKRDDATRKKAVVKLNDLSQQLEERRKQLGAKQAIERQLNAMKNLGKGPAEKAVEAIKNGEWRKAIEEIKSIQDQIAKGELTKEQRRQLANQLNQIQKRLQAASQAQEQAMQDLERKIQEQRQKGNLQQANQLQRKLDQMTQQQGMNKQMQRMAQNIEQARQAMQKGDMQAAAQAMQQMGQQLQEMQQEAEEMGMLDAAMDQIEMAKQAMGCQQCQGMGCQACQGIGNQFDQFLGMGMGEGQGRGPRPDEENPTAMRDSRVRQNLGRGDSVYGGEVRGPNFKGQVLQSLKDEIASQQIAPADPLQEERLPRSRREHAQEYFSKLREGL